MKQHKQSTGCSGLRPSSEYLKIQDMTDQTLIRDFTLLESTQTAVTRPVKSEQSVSAAQKRSALKKLCYDRGIWLKTLPCVFARARFNTSHVRRKTELWWRIEWHFPSVVKADGCPLVLTDTYVEETSCLKDLVDRFFHNTWKIAPVKHQLVSLEDKTLEFFLATDQTKPLDPHASLKDILRGKTIYEFPVILVKPASDALTLEVTSNTSI